MGTMQFCVDWTVHNVLFLYAHVVVYPHILDVLSPINTQFHFATGL